MKNESEKSQKNEKYDNENEPTWQEPKRKPKTNEVRKMFGMALKRLINISMKNHIYEFKNKSRLQSEGGATGYDETGELADLYMLWLDLKFIEKLKHLNIFIDLFARFKDDCNVISEGIPLNLDYDPIQDKLVVISPLSTDQSISAENHTAKVLNKIADSIDGMIAFTYDVPGNHNDGYLSVLDVKVKLQENGRIIYQFYEKSTKNSRVILADSALNWKQKRTILTQEALRRLKNTSLELGHDVQCEHLSDFMLKLKDSGYGEQFRSEIVCSAKKAFENIVENSQKGIKPIHRTREQMILDKGAKKSSGYNWWKKGDKENKYTTVLHVPLPLMGSY